MKATISGDYATLELPNGVDLYYGYEVMAGDEEWCFAVLPKGTTKNPQHVIPFSEFGARDQFDPGECLLQGIAILFERGVLKIEGM